MIGRPAPSAQPADGPAATVRATIPPVLRDEILPVLRDYFAIRANRVVAAYLFGSVARGQERPSSDVDIGVVLGSRRTELSDLDRCARMQIELSDRLGREVDLVPIDIAAPDFAIGFCATAYFSRKPTRQLASSSRFSPATSIST
jgi:predicted nucleotidyltransferase